MKNSLSGSSNSPCSTHDRHCFRNTTRTRHSNLVCPLLKEIRRNATTRQAQYTPVDDIRHGWDASAIVGEEIKELTAANLFALDDVAAVVGRGEGEGVLNSGRQVRAGQGNE